MDWYLLSLLDIFGTSVLVPMFSEWSGSKTWLDINIFAFISKSGVVVNLDDEVTLSLVSLQLLLLLAEHCNSYLGRMYPSDEERIDKMILVLAGRSSTRTVQVQVIALLPKVCGGERVRKDFSSLPCIIYETLFSEVDKKAWTRNERMDGRSPAAGSPLPVGWWLLMHAALLTL